MPDVHVAFAVDLRNLDQVAVVAQSIVDNALPSTDLHFYLLYDGPEEEAVRAMSKWPLATIPSVIAGNPYGQRDAGGRLTNASFLRLRLPDALPHIDRVIYMDADVIVHRDLAALQAAYLDGALVGGVVDLVFYARLGREAQAGGTEFRDYVLTLGLDPDVPNYVNSGILVMDLAKMREAHFADKTWEAYRDQDRHFEYGDQCLINYVLAGRIKLLDPRWNTTAQAHAHPSRWRFLPPNLQRDAATQRRHNWITHYTGPKKPWSNPWVWRAGAWWESALKTGLAWPGGNLLRSLGRARGVLWTIWHGRRGEV